MQYCKWMYRCVWCPVFAASRRTYKHNTYSTIQNKKNRTLEATLHYTTLHNSTIQNNTKLYNTIQNKSIETTGRINEWNIM